MGHGTNNKNMVQMSFVMYVKNYPRFFSVRYFKYFRKKSFAIRMKFKSKFVLYVLKLGSGKTNIFSDFSPVKYL